MMKDLGLYISPERQKGFSAVYLRIDEQIVRAATTVYEAGIAQGKNMSGMQRRRFFAKIAIEFGDNIDTVEADIAKAPSECLHPALFALIPR